MLISKEITYAQTRDKRLRQKYLDSLMPLFPEPVQSLVYDPDWSNMYIHMDNLVSEGYLDKERVEKLKKLPSKAIFLVIFSPDLFGINRQHPIFVSENGFNQISEEHFMNCLFDHEVYHVSDLVNGIKLGKGITINHTNVKLLTEKTIINLREYRANKNQLQRAVERELNDSYFLKLIRWSMDINIENLYSINPKTDFEGLVLRNI